MTKKFGSRQRAMRAGRKIGHQVKKVMRPSCHLRRRTYTLRQRDRERFLWNLPLLVFCHAAVAQLAEHHVANVIVVGSNPISRS